MENKWDGDVECEVQNVSEDVVGTSKAKVRQKRQQSSRPDVTVQDNDLDSGGSRS